ncbi:rhodanese-like domain-containing protein 8, chloroplastic isoform X3 [Ziziphus jujuba]|uniref:Rhodanese-like domain-containing protein 8, chloroplastic isoform X3 n=1 Tax=Ziziphus jujuba TaxID=326968 RepID=A0ABM3IKR4_ZIZJJ|nr:rhodanese-like domain-containing protein 8, chloroplastic isoform X3 [Ziziphus jujuba]
MRVFGGVSCGAFSSILAPLDINRSYPFQPRFCSANFFSHGHPKPFLFFTNKAKSGKNQHGSGIGIGIGRRIPVQCCKCRDVEEDDLVVVNFYRFVFIKDPLAEVAKHLSFLKGFDIKGRIYLNEQGINAQYSGPSKEALAYVEWLKEDERFSDILIQVSPALNGHAFPKLKLRYKPSLVQSGYEWDIGHFHGAQRPDVDCFRSTSFGQSQTEVTASDPLANVDKENTDILMYCTGGIRCDVYSTILRKRGFKNLYTLEGGVSHYLKNVGPIEWVGNLFVFDSRLSLPPSTYKPEVVTEATKNQQVSKNDTFARCFICGSQVRELRHRNCANLDCNLLFLCCMDCVKDLRGCCCTNCTTAPRLRPVLHGHQRYKKWHIYRDSELPTKLTA